MTRVGKKEQRKNRSFRKRKPPVFKKTGPKKENNPYKEHVNAITNEYAFIGKIKEKKNV